MKISLAVRRILTAVAVTATSFTGLAVVASPATAACSDVQVVFARGSTEAPGLGIVGRPLVSAIQQQLRGLTVDSYAVDYAADIAQTSAGPGATDMSNHIEEVAAACPNTSFVIGGYSQGASVTDIAIGIPTSLGRGGTIPTNLAPRVKAVTVFGNPLRLFRQTINSASQLYGQKALDQCATGDPVCGNGSNSFAHLTYAFDGQSVPRAAQFAANLVKQG
ncbi:cutinase family protein [Cryptosporangium phraense]|uniref:Cutinase family protein n=1 Tax=Cryptosporangium phraense TaxID=2593070 RepID=A0A545AQF0_9ACTN|nr:cutinase family protein [Cryptosporangium phraense]TQS43552.1 cutinase family protein [Cryptosporangium phraense]